jgi:DNA-binding NarL/FixJ family response regulator
MPVVRIHADNEADPTTANSVRLLHSSDDLLVVGETDERHLLVLDEGSPDPDVVVVELPASISATERIAEARERHESAHIVVLSPSKEARHAQQALNSGANVYIVTPIDADELAHAVQLAARGYVIIDGRVSGLRVERSPSTPRDRDTVLREREVRTLQLAAMGLTNAEIARILHASSGNVARLLRAAAERLGVESREKAIERVRSSRFLLGRSRRSYGIWDQERPGEAIERFPEADRLLALLRHGALVRESAGSREG